MPPPPGSVPKTMPLPSTSSSFSSPFPPSGRRGSGPGGLGILPDTVLVQIFQTVSRHDLCSVSRLNRRCHALADAVLYKTVQFLTPELHLLFSESLSRRPRRGSAIHDIKLAYPASELSRLAPSAHHHAPGPGPGHASASFGFDSLSRALSTMSNLENLDVEVPEALLHGIGQLFNGPFDLACLRSCTLFYQADNDDYWDLRENIHVFAHPTLETLTIRRAKLDYRGFDLMERPHMTALKRLHLIECDINDDALSDLLVFPKALKEFVMTQLPEPVPELEESSDNIRHYFSALTSARESLESITIDFPTLRGPRALRLREFEALRSLRINWDYHLLGSTSKKPRVESVGLPPELEALEFFNPLGTDDEVTELLVSMIQTVHVTARHLTTLTVVEGDDGVPKEVLEACKAQPQLTLDIIGQMDVDSDD
ncbi:hypothetical protein B0I35DRAFT_440678 [Stachybotrys elegans]|uniref:F-box domain-containing protein n=1 Tax=Stachybotrys elegans TaxID=80388 RepID=A0A8K0SJJ0_9HYPO|nr:hypothetical protein B0I35DRAFT_440678 [Stachybotrys elegans]